MVTGCQSLTPFSVVQSERPEAFRKIGDQRVYVERWGQSGPKVVLLHGFAASSYSFRKLGPLLAKHFEVQALDLNGFGFTERPRTVDAYGLPAQAELVRQVAVA